MKQIFNILLFLISTNSFCQSTIDRTHRLINELIRDIYSDKIVNLDSIPCNDKMIVDGSYLQQNRELINKSLTKDEILFLLRFCDSTKCFILTDKLETNIKSCDSTEIHITDLYNKLKIYKSALDTSFKWQLDKLIQKKKGNKFYNMSFSEPVVNNNETIMIIHIIEPIGKQDLRGETILFKKINNKWTRISNLYSWIT